MREVWEELRIASHSQVAQKHKNSAKLRADNHNKKRQHP